MAKTKRRISMCPNFIISSLLKHHLYNFSIFSFNRILDHFPLLWITHTGWILFSFLHVLHPLGLQPWLQTNWLLWPGIKHCKACSGRHAHAHWYRRFRATSAYSSHCMERRHCEPFMCFVFQCSDYCRVHGLQHIFLWPPLSHRVRTSCSFICDNRTRTWLIQDKADEEHESYGPENGDSNGSSVEKKKGSVGGLCEGKSHYHFQSAACSAWLMLKWHISLSDRACSHSCFFFFFKHMHNNDSLLHTHTFVHTSALLSCWLTPFCSLTILLIIIVN